mmetsp:Transcript_26242/g.46627  ORF Transcript_26242/g.46627 Transcript_26242/m.46627 type:complete len:290 (+) Transcript_26242:513-1382(+)
MATEHMCKCPSFFVVVQFLCCPPFVVAHNVSVIGISSAGNIGSSLYGVAPDAKLYIARALGCNGSGSFANVIKALDWCVERTPSKIINMSLGGGKFRDLDTAVANAWRNHGVLSVVAAGNSGTDACNTSPGGEPTAITVGAVGSDDRLASFSNRGSCVDILGPGVGILSTTLTTSQPHQTATLSGTSMASPHVAGAAALVLEKNRNAVSMAEFMLDELAVEGRISGLPSGTPDRLVQTPFGNCCPSKSVGASERCDILCCNAFPGSFSYFSFRDSNNELRCRCWWCERD